MKPKIKKITNGNSYRHGPFKCQYRNSSDPFLNANQRTLADTLRRLQLAGGPFGISGRSGEHRGGLSDARDRQDNCPPLMDVFKWVGRYSLQLLLK